MTRTVVAICSDLHGGHRQGLLNPDTILQEEDEEGNEVKDYHPELTQIQKYLWGIYTEQINEVKNFTKKDNLIVLMAGDLTAGNKYDAVLVSDRIVDQIIIAQYNAFPWYKLKPKVVRIVKGTGAHNFNQGSSEIAMTKLLQTEFPSVSTKITDHSLLEIDNVLIDVSHHGPTTGSRSWLHGNEARYYLRSLMVEEIMNGLKPPDLVFRGHYHSYVEETLNIRNHSGSFKSTLIVVPGFVFVDNHTRQTTKSPSHITHGMVMAEIVDGKLTQIIPMLKTIDIRSKEKI